MSHLKDKIPKLWREKASCNRSIHRHKGNHQHSAVLVEYLSKLRLHSDKNLTITPKVTLRAQKLLVQDAIAGIWGWTHAQELLRAGSGACFSLLTKDKIPQLCSVPITTIKEYPEDEETSLCQPQWCQPVSPQQHHEVTARHGRTHSCCHLSSALAPQMPFN